jgi:hypothetical protein
MSLHRRTGRTSRDLGISRMEQLGRNKDSDYGDMPWPRVAHRCPLFVTHIKTAANNESAPKSSNDITLRCFLWMAFGSIIMFRNVSVTLTAQRKSALESDHENKALALSDGTTLKAPTEACPICLSWYFFL